MPPTPAPSAVSIGRWVALSTAVLVDDPTLSWSPDGTKILIARNETNGPPDQQFIDVFDATGSLLETYQGFDEARWLDDQHLVLNTFERGPGGSLDYNLHGEPNGTSAVAAIGAEPGAIDVNLAGGLSSGDGAVAYETDQGSSIWTESGIVSLPANLGQVTAWSRDGSRVLLEHPIGDQPVGAPTFPTILSWPDLNTIAKGEGIWYLDATGVVNSDLTRSATWDWPTGSTSRDPVDAKIIDLDSGDSSPLDLAGPMGRAAWAGDDLAATTYPGNDAVEYDSHGRRVDDWRNVGFMVFAARDVPAFAFVNDDLNSPRLVTVATGSRVLALKTPGQIEGGADEVRLSPDGTGLMVVCGSGFNQETAYLTTLD